MFNSPILPGTAPLTKKDHLKMKVVFSILIVVILIIIGGYYVTLKKVQPEPTKVTGDQRQVMLREAMTSQLRNAEVPTASQTSQMKKQLEGANTSITDEQRNEMTKQLQTSI